MNQMEIFKNPEFGSIRTFEQDGKVLFCGTDVATALGYANPRKAVRDHTRCGTKCSIGVQTGKKADGSPAVQMVEMLFTEMAVEDDYGMIDGIINNGPKEQTVAQLEQQARSGQPISLMDLAAAAHREDRDKKKSVVEQLKSQPKPEHKKTAPKKSAEREL